MITIFTLCFATTFVRSLVGRCKVQKVKQIDPSFDAFIVRATLMMNTTNINWMYVTISLEHQQLPQNNNNNSTFQFWLMEN